MASGRPRYWIGVVSCWQRGRDCVVGNSSSGIDIGRNPDLDRLTWRPEDLPKSNRVVMMIFRLFGCAGVMMAVTLANCRTVVEMVGREMRSLSRRLNNVCRMLVARMNNRGERGSA
jgi:hypothetical protein